MGGDARARRPRGGAIEPRRIGGIALVAIGLSADVWSGTALLAGVDPLGLLVHVVAALTWALGVWCLDRSGAPVGAPERWVPSGRVVVALLLGLLLFPGFGAFAFGLAALLSLAIRHYRRIAGRPGGRADDPDAAAGDLTARPLPESAQLLRDLHVQPLVEILGEPDVERKRIVIGMLGRDGDRDAVRLLRGLLVDAHPDVRSDAAVELTRIEGELTRNLGQTLARARSAPADRATQRRLAQLSLRYASSGLLDEPSARHYLAQARQALQAASSGAGGAGDEENWLAFARASRDLGDRDGLRLALATLRALRAPLGEERQLEMELAYAERDWAALAALARAAAPAGAPGEAAEVVGWWASPAGARGGAS